MDKQCQRILLLILDGCCFAGKPASMSSVFILSGPPYDLIAAFANDGIYRPSVDLGVDEMTSLAHTINENNPWWMVDLERAYCIWAVRILNRGILCYYCGFHLEHQFIKQISKREKKLMIFFDFRKFLGKKVFCFSTMLVL